VERLAQTIDEPYGTMIRFAAYADRRPARDIDFAVGEVAGELTAIHTITNEILALAAKDGLDFDQDATTVEEIREHETYPSLRAKVVGALSTAQIRFHIDINIGDPLWPEPKEIELPRLLGSPPLRVRGYSVELILAEKIVTAIQRGTANTRWRDFVDIASLATVAVDQDVLDESIRRVAAHRQTTILPLSLVLDGFADIAQTRWAAWRRKQQLTNTPESFAELLTVVVEFSDTHLTDRPT
jgi:predicted nucleotidyltransferase component of viral defense system